MKNVARVGFVEQMLWRSPLATKRTSQGLTSERLWRCLVLTVLAVAGCLTFAQDARAQCSYNFTAVPLNVRQTYTFVTDSTNTSTFAASGCDAFGKGVYDTSADAALAEQAEEGPIPAGQILGTTYGNFYVGGTPGAEYIQYTPTSNPGVSYTNVVTYYTKAPILGATLTLVTFTINAAPLPTVTSISTAAGPIAGGTTFTITGTNLTAATGVVFGATAASSFTVNSATSITVTSPAHAAGLVDVTVTTPNGTSAISSADQFTFVPIPAITALTPAAGTTAGGTVVMITGTSLGSATQILFNGVAGSAISSTATSANVTTPAHAGGQVDVTLTTSGGTSPLVTADHYTFTAPPIVGASTATVAYDSTSNAIPLDTSGGPTSVAVVSAPVHGTATASGTSISYTPAGGYFGSDSFTYTATNSVGTSTAATVTITVSSPAITITPTSLPSGSYGSAYSQALSVTGGQSPYTFATAITSGAVPTGLALSSAGVLFGTPTAAGTFNFNISGTDSSTATHANFTSTTITLVIAPIVPGPPNIGTVTAGDLQASVRFTAPGSNGGSAIASYTATSSPGGFTATGASSPLTVTGLADGTPYTFTVMATNAVGTGAASAASASVTPTGIPIAGATSKTVAYDSSSNTVALNLSGGAAASVATASLPSHGTATASGTSMTYTPVTGFYGTDSFTYTATNGFGTSAAGTVSVTVTPPTITVTPTTLPNATGLVSYSQTLTATGGKGPYTFSTVVASGALPSGFSLSSAGVVSGLSAVTGTYTFTVSGTDSSTLTPRGFTSSTITINVVSALPVIAGAPNTGTATAGNAQATVTFTPPGLTGGAPITSYVVTSSPGGITASGASSPITVTGLTNGVPYTFTIAAINSAGTGISSVPTNSVTPIAAPIAGSTSAVIPYGANANAITLNLTGGAPTSVAVVAQGAHGAATASGTSISYTPTASFYGSDTFTFNATNSTGTSATATATITINGPTITITPATLTSDTVGSAYSQTLSGNGGQAPYAFSTNLASGALPAGMSLSSTGAITGTPTTAGTSTFTVMGTDSSTPGHASFTSGSISLAVNAVLAGAPGIGNATAADAQATISFTPPASNGGASITGYTVTSSPGAVTASGSGSPITVTGLANNTTYTFTVTATNAAGVSSASAASNAVIPVGAPVVGSASATVAYNSSANPITLNLTGGTLTSVAVLSAASHGTATVSGTTITYTPVTGYFGLDSFTYTGTNATGTSPVGTAAITVSAPTIVVMPTTLPSAALGSAYTQTLGASGGEAPYTFVTTVASGSLPAGLTLSGTGAITGTPTAVGTFTFTVTGADSSTASHATFTSGTITLVVTALLPGSPTGVTATAGNGQATVTFTPPASNGGFTIGSYTVTSSPGNNTATGAGSPITVPGLTNGTAYTFTVTATNFLGTGPASAPSNSVTPLAAPVAGAVSTTVPYNSTAAPITLSLSGGAAASVAVASPAGHGSAVATGTSITYTPATGYFGTDSFTYTATNAAGSSSAATVAVTVSAPTITVSPAMLIAGTDATAYSQSLTAAGGQAPYTFATAVASGVLPAGLTLSSAGVISGTPTASGTFTFTVSGTDSSTLTHAGFSSSSITLTIGAIMPGAPTIGSATAGNAQASVTFTPPAANGGSTVTSYTVTSSPGGLTASGAASPIVVTGLANGMAYTFTATATNSAGTGMSSAQSNSITPKATQTISFSNPGTQSFGSSPLLSATSSSGLAVAFTSITGGVCTITAGGALSFVTPGTCTIAADQVGNSTTSAAPEVTQTFNVSSTVPGAPMIGTATGGDQQAVVTFTAPTSNGGSTVTSYTVTSSPGGITASGPGSPITITGLANGTAYSFTVTATNASGTGPASAASNSITSKAPQTITFNNPGAQTFNATPSLTASATSSLAVTFTSTTAGVCTVTSGGMLSFVTAGTCSIAADQPGNASYLAAPTSTQSFAVTATIPGAPNMGSATAGNTQAVVTFTPSSTGGMPISSYTVTSSPGGLVATGSGSPITIPGLTNGTAYTFTVTATNAVGTSPSSIVSNSVTPSTVVTAQATTLTVVYNSTANAVTLNLAGGAPTSVAVVSAASHGTATASGTTITYTPTSSFYGADSFTYTATNASGTSAPANVIVTVSAPIIAVTPTSLAAGSVGSAYTQSLTAAGGRAPYTFSPALASGALPAGLLLSSSGVLSGLPSAAGTFTFSVSGTDSSTGSGPASFLSTTLTLTINSLLPGAPIIGTATPGNAQASVSFTPPASNGGSTISSYTVTSSPGGLTGTGSSSPITVNGLANGTPYTFTVTATNAAGTGSSSTPSNSVTPAAAPVAGTVDATVAYNSIADVVTLNLSGGAATSVALASASTHGSTTASGTSVTYTPTTGYFGPDIFTYTAANSTGTSAPAAISITISAPTIAVTPSALSSGTVGSLYAQTLSASGGAAPYTFQTTPSSGALPSGLSISISGLVSGTPTTAGTYTFALSGTDSSTATHAAFTSGTLTLVVSAALPGAPSAAVATASGSGQASVAFTAPASNGGSAITSYTVTSIPGGILATGPSSPISVTGLTPGTPYSFLVTATNSAGTGPSSSPSNLVTPQSSQTITFTNPGTQSFGSTLTLSATSSSELPVSFVSNTPSVCTATLAFVSFSSAGTCSIAANQAGDAAYLAASEVTQLFSISALVPGTPTGLTAAAGNGQSTVTFLPPGSTGGSPITLYTVTSSPGGLSAAGGASPITITGLLNGTTYTFTVTAANAAGTGPASLPSNPVTLSSSVTATQAIASTSLTQNHTVTAFTPVIGGSGVAPLIYAIAPTLPAGLGFAATTGTITGTPTVTSPPIGYTVTVTDALLATASANFSLTVNIAVSTAPGSTPSSVTQGVTIAPFTPVVGAGGTAPLAYTVSPALPAGMSLNPATGQITGTPTAPSATTVYTVMVTDSNGAAATATFPLAVNALLVAAPKSVTAAYNSNGTTSTPIDLTSSISGGTPSSIAITRPAAHGVATISGLIVNYTPTQGFYGSDSFAYTATAASVTSAAGTVSISISTPIITAASNTLAGGAIGVAYSQAIIATGGKAPYTFSTSPNSGSLPSGLTLSSAGVLSGTPTTACTCSFTLSGTDSSTGGSPVPLRITVSLTVVAGAPTITAITPTLGLDAGGASVTITGTNFTDTSLVSFGSTPAASVSYVNPLTLTAITPPGTGTVDLLVTTAGGSSPVSSADRFTYLGQSGALNNPLGTAVDGSGNTFIVDPSLGYIVEIPAGCAAISCEKIVGSGFTALSGVAIDSNGNLYALSGGTNGSITEVSYNAVSGEYVQQATVATGLTLPSNSPTGITVDDKGNLYVTDTATHQIVEEPYNAAIGSFSAAIVLTTGSASSAPSGITVDANGDVFYADPGTGTINELTPGSTTPLVLVSGVHAQSVTLDAAGNLYYTDFVANTVTKLPFDGSSFGAGVVIATGLSTPYGLSVDDSGNLLVANNGTKAMVKVTLNTPPSLTFASTKIGATSTDSPKTATLANIGTAALTFSPTSTTNPALTSGFLLTSASTCPQVSSSSAAQTVSQGASCTYAVSFNPNANAGTGRGALTATDDNLNVLAATQAVALTGIALADDTSTVTLTLSPPSPIVFGRTVAITAIVHDSTAPATAPTGDVTFASTAASPIATEALTNGSATVPGFRPSAAGSYSLTGSYTGMIGGIASSTGTTTLIVTKATPTLAYTPSPATQAYGTALAAGSLDATAVDANGATLPGTFVYTTGTSSTILVGGTTVLPVARYTITATFTPADTTDYISGGSVSATYSVTDSTAALSLGDLSQTYTGQPHSAVAATTPENLPVTFTYDGSATPPTAAGSYTVVATIQSPDYSGTATGTLVIAKASPTSVTLVANPNPVLTTTPVTLTATVSSSLSTPTGSVDFVDSGRGIVFATVPLVHGVATFNTNAEPLGIYNLVAAYSGDTDFLTTTSPVLVDTVLDFTLGTSTSSGSSSTATASAGGMANYQLTLAPAGSDTFLEPVTFTVTGQPEGSTYTITPSTIPAGAAATEVSLAVILPQSTASLHPSGVDEVGRRLVPFTLALLLVPFAGRLRRSGKRLARALTLLLLLAAAMGATGCGPASGFYGGSGHQAKTYNIMLIGTSGALTHSTTVVLTVP